MLGWQQIDEPIGQNHGMEELLDEVPTNKERYQKLVGRLIYMSHTRPNIAYDVDVVSQFMHNRGEVHMNATVRLLRYLKSAPGKGLMFSKHGHAYIMRYTDVDWGAKGVR